MIEKVDVTESATVQCAVCQKEILKEMAQSSEDQDYVRYFCSPHCFEEWTNDEEAVKMQEAGDAA